MGVCDKSGVRLCDKIFNERVRIRRANQKEDMCSEYDVESGGSEPEYSEREHACVK